MLLQQILPEDQGFVFRGLSHPEVIPFYGVRYQTYEETRLQLDWYDNMLKEETGVAWKMTDRESGASMGVISVYFYQSRHNKAEVGFWLLPEYWNRGFAREALEAVITYWKERRGLHRLEAFVEPGNTASERLLQKAGFGYEGTLKDCELKEGRYISLKIFARLLT